MSNNRKVLFYVLGLTWSTVAVLAAQDEPLADPHRWELPDGARIVDGPMGPELRLRGAGVMVPIEDFSNGTIEFSMWVSGLPSFVGVLFRVGEADAEHVYFRPHSSDQWDAVQYQPILNNQSTWQLYADRNAAATIPAARWFSVRIEVDGHLASVYLDGAAEPAIDIARLESPSLEGGIRFSAGFRGQGPAGVDAARIRDLVVTHRAASTANAKSPGDRAPGFLHEWRVTMPFVLDSADQHALPDSPGEWRRLTADPSGLVNLSRSFVREGDRRTVLAAVTLRAVTAGLTQLDLDYSDDVVVFLNGRPLYASTNAWESHHPLFLGSLNKDDPPHTLFLPLLAGDNELTLRVTERAFGWGFIARLRDANGVEIDATVR